MKKDIRSIRSEFRIHNHDLSLLMNIALLMKKVQAKMHSFIHRRYCKTMHIYMLH